MNEQEALLEMEIYAEYVREHLEVIRQAYGNNPIAVYKGVIIDSDKDLIRLTERVCKRFPEQSPILISDLESILNPKEILIPSPHVEVK